MRTNAKKWWKLPLCVLLVLLVAAGGYVAYVFFSEPRIEDRLTLGVEGTAGESAWTGEEYTVVSYNVGFGAYTPDFTFFMDGGKQSWAESRESVERCIRGAAETALTYDPDFVLFQEVDTDSTRSYHVDEAALLNGFFPEYDHVAAVNYHSPFLLYPFTQPHGSSHSCLLTQSVCHIDSALRRSLPIASGVKQVLDLDRCYSISRIPVENGRELVLINTHLSAYGTDAAQGSAQLEMLFEDMRLEYEKGNYVICGGDMNHDFTGDSRLVLNPGHTESFSWCQPFPEDLIPQGFTKCDNYAQGLVASTRNTDIPYSPESFTVVLDGFLISDNVECLEVQNMDTGFLYSDHNPVVMRFLLREA